MPQPPTLPRSDEDVLQELMGLVDESNIKQIQSRLLRQDFGYDSDDAYLQRLMSETTIVDINELKTRLSLPPEFPDVSDGSTEEGSDENRSYCPSPVSPAPAIGELASSQLVPTGMGRFNLMHYVSSFELN